jgi:hypothetical protein
MMLLGVIRHAAVSYVPTVFFEWPYRDAQADMLSYWMVIFIRVFNLPVFFAIAGFFAAYLMETRGPREFLRHRWSRLGVPLLVAWPFLAVTMFFFAGPFAARFSSAPPNAAYSLAELTSSRALDHLFMHLWFLYHLMILCVAAGALSVLARRVPANMRARLLDLFENVVHRGGIGVLALLAGVMLYPMQSWAIDYYAGPLPPLRLLGLFGLFFAFGWLVFHRREVLEGFKRPAWSFLAAGLICSVRGKYSSSPCPTAVPIMTSRPAGTVWPANSKELLTVRSTAGETGWSRSVSITARRETSICRSASPGFKSCSKKASASAVMRSISSGCFKTL